MMGLSELCRCPDATQQNGKYSPCPLLRSAYGTYRCRICESIFYFYIYFLQVAPASPGRWEGMCSSADAVEMLGCDDRKSIKEALGDD